MNLFIELCLRTLYHLSYFFLFLWLVWNAKTAIIAYSYKYVGDVIIWRAPAVFR